MALCDIGVFPRILLILTVRLIVLCGALGIALYISLRLPYLSPFYCIFGMVGLITVYIGGDVAFFGYAASKKNGTHNDFVMLLIFLM